MSVFKNITNKVTDTAKAAVRKSGDIVEVTKLNLSIGTEEDKIKKTYTELGRMIYESYEEGGNFSEIVIEYCERIKSYEAAINEMKERINVLKSIKICPSCNTELELYVNFCPICGVKQEKGAQENDEEEQPEPGAEE